MFKWSIPFFNRLYKELSPTFCLVDMFSNHFSFHTVNHKDADTKTTYCSKLNKIYKESPLNLNTVFIIFDANVKNKVVTLILHVWKGQNIIAKTVYCTMNITSTEAELFSIRCGINQAIKLPNISQIIIITDIILAARHIFDLSTHPFQLHSIAVSHNLKVFSNRNLSEIQSLDASFFI